MSAFCVAALFLLWVLLKLVDLLIISVASHTQLLLMLVASLVCILYFIGLSLIAQFTLRRHEHLKRLADDDVVKLPDEVISRMTSGDMEQYVQDYIIRARWFIDCSIASYIIPITLLFILSSLLIDAYCDGTLFQPPGYGTAFVIFYGVDILSRGAIFNALDHVGIRATGLTTTSLPYLMYGFMFRVCCALMSFKALWGIISFRVFNRWNSKYGQRWDELDTAPRRLEEDAPRVFGEFLAPLRIFGNGRALPLIHVVVLIAAYSLLHVWSHLYRPLTTEGSFALLAALSVALSLGYGIFYGWKYLERRNDYRIHSGVIREAITNFQIMSQFGGRTLGERARSYTDFIYSQIDLFGITSLIAMFVAFATSVLLWNTASTELFIGGSASWWDVLIFAIDTVVRALSLDIGQHFDFKLSHLEVNRAAWLFVGYLFLFRVYCAVVVLRAVLGFLSFRLGKYVEFHRPAY
jgi:hypothetical protein